MKQMLVRTSERGEFKRCRQRWAWKFIDHMSPKVSSPALRFGTLVHEALAEYYKPGVKRGPHPTKTFKKAYKAQLATAFEFGMRNEDDSWVNARELGIAVLDHYIETYGDDDMIEIIQPEMPFQVDVHNEAGKYICTYTGIFDAVIKHRATKEVGLFEHKTAGTISTNHLTLDEQAGAYWLFAPEFLRSRGILKKGQDLDMVLYNFLRKSKPDERPQNEAGQRLNKNGDVSKVQPPPYFLRYPVYRSHEDRETVLQRIIMETREIKLVRAGKLGIYKNPTRDCSWDCGFFDMCELHESGDDWKESARLLMTTWDPYASHRDDLDGRERPE